MEIAKAESLKIRFIPFDLCIGLFWSSWKSAHHVQDLEIKIDFSFRRGNNKKKEAIRLCDIGNIISNYQETEWKGYSFSISGAVIFLLLTLRPFDLDRKVCRFEWLKNKFGKYNF